MISSYREKLYRLVFDLGPGLRFAHRIAFHRLVARSNRNSRTVWLAAYWRCGERSLHDRWRHSYSRRAFTPRGIAHLGMGHLDERLRVNGLHHDRQRDRRGNFDGGVGVVASPVVAVFGWKLQHECHQPAAA